MSLVAVTPPTAEPLDLADAKLHLRVGFSTDDSLIGLWVSAARDYAENTTRKQLVTARWKQVMDAFPGGGSFGANFSRTNARPSNAIYLERGPALQVVSIQYLDLNGVTQTVSPSTYTVDLAADPVRITPVFGQVWPVSVVPQIGAVWVTFDAGYCAPIIASGNNITVQGWPTLTVGSVVRFSNSGGALPAPLKVRTDYFIQSVVSANVYTVSATSGGGVLALTDTGSGTSYLGVVPEGISAWMKMRLGALYENREELDQGGLIKPLPYVDRLLDAYKTYEF
jgi:uncharacterized phiE125 gp8 family phage protein